MKYLNEESQFTRVSDAHAKSLMESAGYEVPSEEEVRVDVYAFEDARFALTEEVVEAEDGLHYIRLQELDENFTVSLDESGEEILVEFVEFDETDYILEGVYEDGEGNLFACMLSESDFEDEDEDVEEVDENAEKGYKGMKGGSKEAKAEEMRRKKKAKKADKPAEEADDEDED